MRKSCLKLPQNHCYLTSRQDKIGGKLWKHKLPQGTITLDLRGLRPSSPSLSWTDCTYTRPSAPKSTTNKHQDVNRNKHGGENPEKSLLYGKADGLEPRGLQGGAQGGKIYKPDQTTSSPLNSSHHHFFSAQVSSSSLPEYKPMAKVGSFKIFRGWDFSLSQLQRESSLPRIEVDRPKPLVRNNSDPGRR